MKKSVSKESNLVVAGILGFLSDTGKANLLSTVVQALDEVADKTKKAEQIVVTSQIPLNRGQLGKLRASVRRFLKRELPMVNRVDKSLLGGFTIRVGDFFLDASLANELANVKQLLLS